MGAPDDTDEQRPLFDIVRGILGERHARELAQELWGLGLTIAPRKCARDPFEIEPASTPPDKAYQWVPESEVDNLAVTGWLPVPASRHDGLFAPIGSAEPIKFHGMALVDRHVAITAAANQARIDKAYKNVEDWHKKWGAVFAGHVKVGTSEEMAETRFVGDRSLRARLSAAAKIPPELWDVAGKIFAERDRLRMAHAGTDKEFDESYLTETAISYVAEAEALRKKDNAA